MLFEVFFYRLKGTAFAALRTLSDVADVVVV